MYDGYEELAAAIVLQAFKDWCSDCKKLAAGTGNINIVKKDMAEILEFVNSGFYKELTSIPPEVMLEKLKEEKDKYDTERISEPGVSPGAKNTRKRNKSKRI